MNTKESKAAPIFWAVVACVGEGVTILGSILGAVFVSPLLLLVGLLPAGVIGLVLYFLRQSLQEIDERETHREEWKNY